MNHSKQYLNAELAAANKKAYELIDIAQELLGPMSSAWGYDGVVFNDHTPHLSYSLNTRSIQISLSLKAIGDELQRNFQLAHEVCHLLYPSAAFGNSDKPKPNLINEGISTYFSVAAVDLYHGEEASMKALRSLQATSPRYYFAFQQVSSLFSKDKYAVKKIREVQPMINQLTSADFLAVDLGLNAQEIETLIELF